MNTVDNKIELEDGEINDLEDGEIEDDENGSISSRRQRNYTEVLPSLLDEEFQAQNAKRYPVRDRRRQRNEFDDLERGREWRKGRNGFRERNPAQFVRSRGREQNFHGRSANKLPVLSRRRSLSPDSAYSGYMDLRGRSLSPSVPGPHVYEYSVPRHRLSPSPLYDNLVGHPELQQQESSLSDQFSRGEHPSSRNFALRPFFGVDLSHLVRNKNFHHLSQSEFQKENRGDDDFELLLERHKLIQQQLESLEKQEKAALAADVIIDDTFIDIPLNEPVNEADTNLIYDDITGNGPDITVNENKAEETIEQLSEVRNVENEIFTQVSNQSNSFVPEQEYDTPKSFLPFKIKPQYSSVPTLSERSRVDLEMRNSKGESTTNLSTTESNTSDNLLAAGRIVTIVPSGSQTVSSGVSEVLSKRQKRRRRARKRKNNASKKLNSGTLLKSNAPLVDPHVELENKLFDMAVTSKFEEEPSLTHSEHLESNSKAAIQDQQKKRKAQLKKWQESRRKQQNFASRSEKNNNISSRSVEGQNKKNRGESPRKSFLNPRSTSSKAMIDFDEFEFDDYLEMPMDVESDSADGPVLPLIEDASDKPPPPPLPSAIGNQFVPMMEYQDPATHVYGGTPFPSQGHDGDFGATFYNSEQEHFGKWPAAFDEEGANLKIDGEVPARMIVQATNKNEDDGGNDDDDEDALRALLLKSMANKRAAKLAAENKTSPVSSAPASPGPEPQKLSSGRSSSLTGSLIARPTPKPIIVPPQHEPVVIKLGPDSDDSDEDVEEDKREVGSGSGSLFGGLELMIKEARKSASVSKPKVESPDRKEASNEKLSDSKTPEALEHMPDSKKAEYKRLKEKLAQYEKKKRQPLSAVNQDKESSDISATKNKSFPPALIKLAGHVKECELTLAKHRKILDQDQALLSTVNSNVAKKKLTLERQEANVQQLQQQLESAQRIVLRSRLLMNKLNEQGKSIKERVTRKLLVISDVEEELLRAKSFVSASKRQPVAIHSAESTENDDQMMLEMENKRQGGAVGSENKSGGWSGAALVQQITDTLVQKLQKLSEVNKKEMLNEGKSAKRALQDTVSSSGDEMMMKKSRVESHTTPTKTRVIPGGSLSKSAPNTPRKSAVAERIALEKARLKKEEHELAEKLKLYNSLMDKESEIRKSAVTTGVPVKMPAKVAETFKSIQQDNNIKGEVLIDSEETQNTLVEATNDGESDIPQDTAFDMSEQQLEYVRKLQSEKEQETTTFEMASLELPVPVHQSASQCVWLSSKGPLKSLVPNDETNVGTVATKAEADMFHNDSIDNFTTYPLEKYQSVLLYFRSYRLSPYYRTQSNLLLSSSSFASKLEPNCPLCNFDLQGTCNDEECPYQHAKDYELGKEEILQDIAAYDVHSSKKNESDTDSFHNRVVQLAAVFDKQYKEKMSVDEICLLLVNKVRRTRKITGPYSIAEDPRLWRPTQEKRKAVDLEQERVVDRGKGINFPREECNFGVEKAQFNSSKRGKLHCEEDESQEVRYFSESYSAVDGLEAALSESPHDIELWIKLACLKLRQKSDCEEKIEQLNERNLRQALSTLSRGLEANRNSEELWMFYLQLFTGQGTAEDIKELYEQALDFAPAYCIWWQYIEFQASYSDKKILCLRLLNYLVEDHWRHSDNEVQSHYVLETILYVVQLELFTGRYKRALEVFQAALGRAKSAQGRFQIPNLTAQLLPSDLCLLWIAYIHVFEFHRVPLQWYEASCGKPSRMVAKELFVFPWQPSKGSRASDEKLLSLFHDALKACTNRKLPKGKSVSVAMPLYMNLVAMERAHDRLESAKGICTRLLKSNSTTVELWQCRAALEQSESHGCIDNVKKIYNEALVKCRGHAAIVYSAARFYSEPEQDDPITAHKLLVHHVYSKFAATGQSHSYEMSLAEEPLSSELPDPELLYRKLLSLSLPYDFKCPPLLQNALENQEEQQVFVWLNYCLLIELSSSDPNSQNQKLEGTYETAVHSALDRKSIQSLWLEYLYYKRSRVLQSGSDNEKLKEMEDLVHRCLVSCPTARLVVHSTTSHWQDYSFHNQVISLYLGCLPLSRWSAVLCQFLKWFPNNTNLTLHAATIELRRNCIKEAHKLYQQATEKLPFAATLWKDFLMFEIARSDSRQGVSGIVDRCRKLGVDIEEFYKTLQGK